MNDGIRDMNGFKIERRLIISRNTSEIEIICKDYFINKHNYFPGLGSV